MLELHGVPSRLTQDPKGGVTLCQDSLNQKALLHFVRNQPDYSPASSQFGQCTQGFMTNCTGGIVALLLKSTSTPSPSHSLTFQSRICWMAVVPLCYRMRWKKLSLLWWHWRSVIVDTFLALVTGSETRSPQLLLKLPVCFNLSLQILLHHGCTNGGQVFGKEIQLHRHVLGVQGGEVLQQRLHRRRWDHEGMVLGLGQQVWNIHDSNEPNVKSLRVTYLPMSLWINLSATISEKSLRSSLFRLLCSFDST